MLFSSIEFIFGFMPIVLLSFYGLCRLGKTDAALNFLGFASLFFYSWWDPSNLLLILLSITGNYLLGRSLQADSPLSAGQKKWLLRFGVMSNLGLLIFYKYSALFFNTLAQAMQRTERIQAFELPLAISFFTFLQIAFIVDVYRQKSARYSFRDYILFVIYFPHLIAGPIVHHGELIPQFHRPAIFKFSAQNFAVGISIFTLGLFNKLVIADSLAIPANAVFAVADQGSSLGFWQAWQGILAYALQLYFDFSGYSTMAIGLSRLFGIDLPLNFDSPYKACSIIDFWRRWHKTLSRFLRDYLYFALGGNRSGFIRRYVNLFLTMALGGLWHGAGWNFFLWGALHGSYLIINHAWRALLPAPAGRILQLCYGAITFVAVLVGWVFFRAKTASGAWLMLQGMFAQQGLGSPVEFIPCLQIGIGLAIVWLLPNMQQIFVHYKPALMFDREEIASSSLPIIIWQPTLGVALVLASLLTLSLLYLGRVAEFLYFQF